MNEYPYTVWLDSFNPALQQYAVVERLGPSMPGCSTKNVPGVGGKGMYIFFTSGGWIRDVCGELLDARVQPGDTIHFGDRGGYDYCKVRIERTSGGTYTPTADLLLGKNNTSTAQTGAIHMTGSIFNAAVVRTKTVAVADGVTTGIQVSEVVHSKVGFAATSPDIARAIVQAEAIKAFPDLDFASPTEPVEVKLQQWA